MKKLFALILAMAMALSLVACGGSSDSDTDDDGDASSAGLQYVQSGDINADFECNPLAAPFVDEVIKQLEAGETPETTVYMEEHWYTYDDTVSTFEVDGVEQSVTVVTDEIIDAQY
ncbi:MAG: hypothetical protein LUF84_01320 [Clostridiales bacterium]|nr:hypothetical protein [Clostridiales bacterium]